MKTYIYTVDHSSTERGYNRTIVVYRIKRNQPLIIGTNNRINTASYKGDYAIASAIIAKHDNHQLNHGGYFLKNKSIKLIEV